MVDEKKVRTMIELARYEEGEGKEDLRIRRFYRGDYLTVQLIKNWFLTTISYILLLALLSQSLTFRRQSATGVQESAFGNML